MPEMDGHEVCLRLKLDPATSAIPVLFVTGMADDAERAVGLALGATDYIAKPDDPDDPDDLLIRVDSTF